MRLESDPFARLTVGMTATRQFTFTPEKLDIFGDLVGDHAPVHFDPDFALERGFSHRIVHGLFVASIFSGMLGNELPGPHSVINQLSVKYHSPILVKETAKYEVAVEQVSPAARAVVLKLAALRSDGKIAVSGRATCSFPRVSEPVAGER